tara:strand:+ start:2520 stop:2960 length:441 start_codon:yes stop_codon:yes gene_type:complete
MENEAPNTVSGLIRKRAELAGQMEHHQAMVRQLIIDLDHIDATLRLFQPDITLEDIKPKPLPPRHAAYKGEVARVILGALRESSRPMTTEELAQHVMAGRSMNTADKNLTKTVTKRVGSCLRHHRAKGVLRSVKGADGFLVWELVG